MSEWAYENLSILLNLHDFHLEEQDGWEHCMRILTILQ